MNYEARKHFEAVISDLAEREKLDRDTLREDIKIELIASGIIQYSTTELPGEALEQLADRLHQRLFYLDTNPPEYWPELDLKKLLFNS